MNWSEQIVAELARLKRRGFKYSDAWRLALQRFPPRQRDLGEPGVLFDVDDPEAVPLDEFMRRACEAAWHGWRPELDNTRALRGGFPEPEHHRHSIAA